MPKNKEHPFNMPGKNSELRELIDILFNPIQAEYNNEAPMMPGDISRVKAEILALFSAHTTALLDRLEAEAVSVDNPFGGGVCGKISVLPIDALQSERALIEKRMM